MIEKTAALRGLGVIGDVFADHLLCMAAIAASLLAASRVVGL